MSKTKISWAEFTWNPIVGCTKVSPGCKNCYAERMAKRLKGMGVKQYQNVVNESGWTGITSFAFTGFKHKKPALVFVCSMGDLFHESVPFAWHDTVFDFIRSQPQCKFLILTKRPDLLCSYSMKMKEFPENVWVGTSVCTQKEVRKIDFIGRIQASVRFVSIEPMLEPIDMHELCCYGKNKMIDLIDWVITGGESGPGARPVHPDWVRLIRDQCKESGTPFHFKQWGEFCYPEQMPEETFSQVDRAVNLATGAYKDCYRAGKKAAGRFLDGVIHDEFPRCLK